MARKALTAVIQQAGPGVLANMTFTEGHRAKLHSTNPIERLNGEIKRCTVVGGIFPNDGAVLLEQNGEWAVQRGRHVTLGPKVREAKPSTG